MELMQSTSPSTYTAVLELDKKLRELSTAIDIYEDEQLSATAATLEWNCILGANMRQAGEHLLVLFVFNYRLPVRVRRSRSPTQTRVRSAVIFPSFASISIAMICIDLV